MQYIHAVGNYSAINKKEILMDATGWVNLEKGILNEISQKDTYRVLPFI